MSDTSTARPALSPPVITGPPAASASVDERILATLTRLEARLDTLERRLGPALDAVEQAPGLVGMAVDMADDVAQRLGNMEDRVRGVFALSEAVSRPEVLAQLQEAIALLQQVPGLAAMSLDIVDGFADGLRKDGAPLGDALPAARHALLLALRVASTPAVRTLSPELAQQGAALATAALAAATKPAAPVGALGLWRALSDPAVQRGLGTALQVLRALGASSTSNSWAESKSLNHTNYSAADRPNSTATTSTNAPLPSSSR